MRSDPPIIFENSLNLQTDDAWKLTWILNHKQTNKKQKIRLFEIYIFV